MGCAYDSADVAKVAKYYHDLRATYALVETQRVHVLNGIGRVETLEQDVDNLEGAIALFSLVPSDIRKHLKDMTLTRARRKVQELRRLKENDYDPVKTYRPR